MKIVMWILGLVVVAVSMLYVFVFTATGNDLIKPMLQTEIQKQTKMPSRLEVFRLSMGKIELRLALNEHNTISINGSYSILKKAFDLNYNVKFKNLKTLKPLTNADLRGTLFTDGRVVGDLKHIDIDGKSDIAKSNSKYHIILDDFNPTSIIAKINSADLASILYMTNQKEYAKAKVDLDVNFKNITPHKLDGDIILLTKNGILNSHVMKKDFNITVPKNTAFSMNLNAKLDKDLIDYKYLLHSNLAKLSSSGDIVATPLKLNTAYKVDVKELALLKPITGADVRGPLHINGVVKGTKKAINIDGTSDIAGSNTTFAAILNDFAPKSFKATVKGLKLEKMLYMIKQPHYADASIDMDINILNAVSKNLKGNIKTDIYNGLLDSKYLTKAYEFESMMPKTSFSAKSYTKIDKNLIDTKINLVSTLARLDIKQVRFNLKDKSLSSDYLVHIDDLNKLYFITQRDLKGSFVGDGELVKAKDLDFTLYSNIAGGKLNAKLHNELFHADLNQLKTLDILDILVYPKIFKSTIDGDLDYNLATSKGDFKGFLNHGSFTKNATLDLVKKYAHTNLYIEKFQGKINAKINKENILSTFDLRSNTSSIKSTSTRLNTLTKKINAKIDIVANKNPLKITLKGDIKAPKVGVDARELISREATKALQKEARKYINKESTKKLQKEVGNLLKGLF